MSCDLDAELILVTGASGHIGSEWCRTLRARRRHFLPVDVIANPAEGISTCDLTMKDSVRQLFVGHRVDTWFILPGSCRARFCATR